MVRSSFSMKTGACSWRFFHRGMSQVKLATATASAVSAVSVPVIQQDLRVGGVQDGYPLVNIQKAIENGHRNSEFSQKKW